MSIYNAPNDAANIVICTRDGRDRRELNAHPVRTGGLVGRKKYRVALTNNDVDASDGVRFE